MRYFWLSMVMIVTLALSGSGFPAVSPQVQNPDVLEDLNDEQRHALEANGFVVVADRVPQIYSIYKSASERGWPAFVTTDAVLHAYHVLYDYALRQAEYQHLVPALDSLAQTMLDASLEQERATSGEVRLAAQKNVAFFSVTQQLLNPGAPIPAEVEDQVEAELELIMAHSGIAESPNFGIEEDYSQYVPRGHYTRNETFERYFRAMTWLGRMSFLLRPGDTPEAIEMGRQLTRQAILIVDALQRAPVGDQNALAVWERIYLPTVFFVGSTDDLNVYDHKQLMADIYGDSFKPSDLEDVNRLNQFMESALRLRSPRIVSSPVDDREDESVVTKGFRFMGQRFVFDSYIFQQLVYDQVGVYLGTGQPFTAVPAPVGFIRGFPRGLDVASVFGSGRALEIMQTDGDTGYEGYEEQMTLLRQEVESLPPEQWSENLYWNWLHSLRPLLRQKDQPYPAFMRNPAWVDKDLQTFLGSWTELRHDTLLYAKQSMTMRATSAQPEPQRPRGYVEPQPEVYTRLASLCRQMKEGLQSYELLNVEMESKLEQMEEALKSLEDISLKELKGQTLSEDDYYLIQRFGHIMEGLTTFSTVTDDQLSSEADERMAVVADVHTDPNSGQVLQEAVGDAFRIYVLVSSDGGTTATVGGVFSYYEFKQPMSDRLTDEAWQAMDPKPPQPDWTASFIVK